MVDTEPNPAMRARLAYLDHQFTWVGQARRRDLMTAFGISNAQAAIDFRIYLERVQAPGPVYDPARKIYVAHRDHAGLEGTPSPASLEQLFAHARPEGFAHLSGPLRQCPPLVMRQLNQAIETGQSVEIDYTSMSTGRRNRQWIAPAHIASDGERLHVRAWSFEHQEWRDYLPVRVCANSSFATCPLEVPLPADADWDTIIVVRLRPRSDLTPDQQQAVRLEYGFDSEFLEFEIRRALDFYVDRRWGLDRPGARLERV